MHAKLYNTFYYKKDRLNQIRGFCALVQTGDIVKAAAKIGVQASSVSKQIKALERDLGINLFKEKKNIRDRLVLSEDGMKFYEHALELVQNMDSIYREFAKDMEYERTNVLRIAGSSFILSNTLPEYIRKLKMKFKTLVIEICDIPKDEAFERLKNNDIDIAFYHDSRGKKLDQIEIQKNFIVEDGTYIICDKNHPLLKLKDLKKSDIEKYPYMFLQTYTSNNPNEYFNFTKRNFVFEKLDWNLIKEYIFKTENILIATKSFYEKNLSNDNRFSIINIDKYDITLGIFYFLLTNKKQKVFVNSLIKLIKNNLS